MYEYNIKLRTWHYNFKPSEHIYRNITSPGSAVGPQAGPTDSDAGRAKVLRHHSVPVDAGEQLQHEHVWPPRPVISNPLHLNPAAAAGLASGAAGWQRCLQQHRL